MDEIEAMRWKLYKVYPPGDWTADVESWDARTVRRKFLYYTSTGQIKQGEK